VTNKAFVYAYAIVLLILGFALIGGCGEEKKAGDGSAAAASRSG
jgi:hypothetical protein